MALVDCATISVYSTQLHLHWLVVMLTLVADQDRAKAYAVLLGHLLHDLLFEKWAPSGA